MSWVDLGGLLVNVWNSGVGGRIWVICMAWVLGCVIIVVVSGRAAVGHETHIWFRDLYMHARPHKSFSPRQTLSPHHIKKGQQKKTKSFFFVDLFHIAP